jgi:uncharacterized protein (TIGR02453 family)
MAAGYFTRASLEFFNELRAHNDRDWFLANKQRYETQVKDPFLRLIADLSPDMRKINPNIVVDASPNGGSMMRIYRDIRFSKDKSPYKTHVAAHFHHRKAKDDGAPAYYLRIEQGNSMAGGGVWQPATPALKKIRDAIVGDSKAWVRVTEGMKFGTGCSFAGESLSRPPAGFKADHPLIEDIKRKDFAIGFQLTDREVCSREFNNLLLERYRVAAPFLQFLSKALGLP